MWNLKYGTNELIYKTDSEIQRIDLGCQAGAGKGERWTGSLGLVGSKYYI